MRVMKCNDVLLMLDYFKEEHKKTNRALIDGGEGERCTERLDSKIQVKDIVDFMERNTNRVKGD